MAENRLRMSAEMAQSMHTRRKQPLTFLSKVWRRRLVANTCCWPQLRRLPSPLSTTLLKASPLSPTMVRPLPSQKSENAAHPYKPASTGSPSLAPVTTRRSPTRISHPPPPKTWSITPICSVETHTSQHGLAPCGPLPSLLALPPSPSPPNPNPVRGTTALCTSPNRSLPQLHPTRPMIVAPSAR